MARIAEPLEDLLAIRQRHRTPQHRVARIDPQRLAVAADAAVAERTTAEAQPTANALDQKARAGSRRQRELLEEFEEISSSDNSPQSTGFFSRMKEFFEGLSEN